MKLISKISVFILVFVVLFAFMGCLNETENPADTGPTENDDDTTETETPVDYGSLYFSSELGTVWLTEGSVTVQEGNLLAQNDGSASRIGSATLYEPLYFGDDRNITITWKESIEGNGSYNFWISDTLEPNQRLSYSEDANGNMVSQFSMNIISKVHLYYEFEVPDGSSVLIYDIHAYAK